MFKKKNKLEYISDPRQLIVHNDPKSPISEQYRTIRTNIIFSAVDKEMKTILLTSGAPNAGKSTTAANVAIAFAQTGKKTLLIDCDLRRPTMHYTFETTNTNGLSSAIVNDINIQELIELTDIHNLHLLTAGPIPPNPAELLQSFKMKNLMKTLEANFDFIIVDTPPALSVADASILSDIVDGVLIVTNTKTNSRDELRKTKESLQKANANILGIVLNNKKMTTRDSYYYYYGGDK
ncbi:polysaccharide biosynthesis tyrosine autokinase [Macrococcus hajekii]|uniref:non-specific protein-tyrosine kinase n=1 Tax=Macrococcus hajekii TaxID=198482 RepID=A0A4R6BNE0_9STAP|nr:CpsD/CapB family tyrosine-protein kinase [Macrococcus hajekii]TDM03373.1 polysaccharide biosynthesis tyrosine autokinase [Macrococcus hajekii]GGA98317.1 capsular polysaccharide biosynthesis protein Cap5B [Macrococcus hajekii]